VIKTGWSKTVRLFGFWFFGVDVVKIKKNTRLKKPSIVPRPDSQENNYLQSNTMLLLSVHLILNDFKST
jgi:hypothetical protein